jgi:hypothetical protein
VEKYSCIVISLYRPGSEAVSSQFFEELTAIWERFAVYDEPIFVIGDLNIRLDRRNDAHADQLRHLIGCYGLVLHSTGPTHQRGGSLDVVISREGDALNVSVDDLGVSDHFLVQWTTPAVRIKPLPSTVITRPWRRLNLDDFRSALLDSRSFRRLAH